VTGPDDGRERGEFSPYWEETKMAYCPKCGQTTTDQMVDGGGWCPDHGRVLVDYERPVPPVKIRDRNNVEIREGMEVVSDGRVVGLVTGVTEEDGDYSDDAGRDVRIGPAVLVECFDGTKERWLADEGITAGWFCDDVEVRP
jgi:hypothetical protein